MIDAQLPITLCVSTMPEALVPPSLPKTTVNRRSSPGVSVTVAGLTSPSTTWNTNKLGGVFVGVGVFVDVGTFVAVGTEVFVGVGVGIQVGV